MMDAHLQKSIEQYRRIIDHAKQLDLLVSKGDPAQLQAYTTKFQELQAEAGLHDRELFEAMTPDAAHWQAHPLFQERLQLLKEIVEMNNLLLPRIHGIMSVTAAELAQIKDGLVVVAGYFPAAPRSRGSVRGVG